MVDDTHRLMRLLLFAGLFSLAMCQSDDDSSLHFDNATSGRAVWLVEESSLPWIGSYEYLSSLVTENTVLLTVVDSSTGRTLGECTTQSHGSKWVKFSWALAADSMQCTVSPTNSSRVVFPAAPGPRVFSVRIQAGRGPACIRQMIVQNEKPIGCPPHLARNSFSSMHFACSCPYEINSSEEPAESLDPQFPIFELGGSSSSSPTAETPAWTMSPCANHKCQHNGTCVVTQEGQATCLCQDGFVGAQCEVDVCASVPCQNGGVCRTNGGNEAVCECPAGFTGLLCESASCNPECSNGECVVTNGTAHCKCRQGFIGINCNVVDVCLGDAACAMFGESAQCVLDTSNYIMHSPALVNATYDCRCPHPVNGEFLDCLELHLATRASAGAVGSPAPTTVEAEMFPNPTVDSMTTGHSFNMFPNAISQPGMLPTQAGSTLETVTQMGTTHPTLGVFPQTSFPSNPTHVQIEPSTLAVLPFTGTPSIMPHSSHPSATFVVPQTFQTTTEPSEHQSTHAIFPESTTEEEVQTTMAPEHSFPTPAPMETSTDMNGFNPFHALVSSTKSTELEETTTETVEETTTGEDYEEQESHESTPTTTMFTQPPTVRTVQTETPTHQVPSTQSTLPFWMQSTLAPTRVIPQAPKMPHQPFVPSPSSTSEERPTEETTRMSTNDPDIHQQETGNADHQSSSATSWIVSILAMIVVGLLLLAAVLFILRYMKQSRKLHGKYNPAREEHCMSAAYAMPMSHITKEERLI